MSTSPFEIFRRNLKPLMVLLTLLALFAFVVLPALDTYLRRGGAMNPDRVAAVYDGVEVTHQRVAQVTQTHASIVRFLGELARETMQRGGMPQTPGFQLDQQSGQIRALGIDASPSEQATVNTMRFYNEARKAGFELDDTAVKNWLSRFTDNTMDDNEIVAMLMRSSGNQLGQHHLYEQLRTHLLADLYQRGSLVGLTNGQIPVVTPVGQWQNFLKISQKASVDAYGVLVAEYIDETEESPSQSEMQRVYEEGKDRLAYPDDSSSAPRFRRPDSAKFEYLAAKLSDFVDREKVKFTEDQLRAEYEKRLAGGDFQLPIEEANRIADDAEKQEAEKKETEQNDEEKKEADAATEPEESDPKEKEGEPAKEEPSDNESSRLDARDPSVRLVVLQAADEEKADTPESPEVDAPESKSAENKPADEKPAAEKAKKQDSPKKKAVEEKPEPKKDAPEKDVSDKKADADKKESADKKEASKQDAEKADTPASDNPPMKEEAKPAEKQPAEKAEPVEVEKKDTPKSDDEMDLGDEPETKPQPFEEVRDQIATEMAADAARVALDRAVTEVNKRMRSYFADRTIHETNVSVGVATEEEAPERLDLKALAQEFGLEHGTTELVNRVSANETVPGSSYGLGSNFNQRGAPFAAMMFGAQTQDGLIPPQPEYSPLRTVDLEAAITYVTWKTEDIEAFIPTLDECRDEVVLAIRMEQARELARADAEKIAQEASVEGKTLADVVPESKKANYLTGVGPFSWLDQVGFMQTSIGNVPELDAVGTDFMKKVFSSQVGEVVVAPNDRGSVFYVVTPTEFQPGIDQLQQQFRQPQQRFMAQLLGNHDAREIVRGFYESVDERTGFEMNLASDQQ